MYRSLSIEKNLKINWLDDETRRDYFVKRRKKIAFPSDLLRLMCIMYNGRQKQ